MSSRHTCTPIRHHLLSRDTLLTSGVCGTTDGYKVKCCITSRLSRLTKSQAKTHQNPSITKEKYIPETLNEL